MIAYETEIYDSAYSYYGKALNIHLDSYNENNEIIALDYNNMAYAIYQLGGLAKAKEYITNAMKIVESNINMKKSNLEIIKRNFEIIENSQEYDFLDALKNYKIELLEHGDTLIIKSSLKK